MPKYKCRATMGTDLYCIVEAKDEHDAIEKMKDLSFQGKMMEEGDGFFNFHYDPDKMPDDTDLEPEFEEDDDE